ncbi:MAG TPA: hypothetical protein IAA79_08095 [Candidatus Avirikenella pullistercoris]|nr:hypothetical protein [Candidatus Avirikenella pullistercoris]
MKKLILLFITFFTFSCDKDGAYDDIKEIEVDCEYRQVYNLEICNPSDYYTYYVLVDYEHFATLKPNQSIKKEMPAGKVVFNCMTSLEGDNQYYTSVEGKSCEDYKIDLKVPPVPYCEKNNAFFLFIKNNESDNYNIYINKSFISKIGKNETQSFALSAGKGFEIRLEQIDGYIFYPTVYNEYVSGEKCETINITIQ